MWPVSHLRWNQLRRMDNAESHMSSMLRLPGKPGALSGVAEMRLWKGSRAQDAGSRHPVAHSPLRTLMGTLCLVGASIVSRKITEREMIFITEMCSSWSTKLNAFEHEDQEGIRLAQISVRLPSRQAERSFSSRHRAEHYIICQNPFPPRSCT